MGEEQGDGSLRQLDMDLEAGRRARDAGMGLAAAYRSEALDVARKIAREVATVNNGQCDINDVRRVMFERGISYKSLGNAAGSVFKKGEWMPVGISHAQSVCSHTRLVRRWILNDR